MKTLMQKVPQEKKIQKLVEKGNAAEAQEAIKARTTELHKAMSDSEEKIKRSFNNRKTIPGIHFHFFLCRTKS
jgi:hypothetical protein